MKKRQKQSNKPACMSVMRVSMKKNSGVIGGFLAATFGRVLLQNVLIIQLINEISTALVGKEKLEVVPYVWILLAFYIISASLKKGSALLKVCFSRNISVDVEQDLIKRYSSIRYRDYYFETDQVLGQVRGNGISAVTSWCDLIMETISKGKMLVVVTHDPESLKDFDRIIIMENLKPVFVGNYEELQNSMEYQRWLKANK